MLCAFPFPNETTIASSNTHILRSLHSYTFYGSSCCSLGTLWAQFFLKIFLFLKFAVKKLPEKKLLTKTQFSATTHSTTKQYTYLKLSRITHLIMKRIFYFHKSLNFFRLTVELKIVRFWGTKIWNFAFLTRMWVQQSFLSVQKQYISGENH